MTNSKPAKKAVAPKTRLGYGYFIAAAVFLFNPCINIIDILPDFFGYLFLMKGLSGWADLCPNITDAVTGIGKLRWFMLIKLLAMVLVPLVDDTYVLIFTFAFAIIELIYAIPAASRIFDGLEYFGTRFDSRPIFTGLKNLRFLTNLFFIGKSAFCILPELCSLSSYEYSGYVTSGVQIDFAQYKGILTVINIIIGSLLGVMWLINLIPYINRISKDTPFLIRVLHDYDLEIGQNIGLHFRRTLRTSVTLLIAGMVFFPNMWIDNVNIIPTFIGAIFIIAAMIKLGSMTPVPKSSIVIPTAFAVTSAISYAISLHFGVFFRIGDVYRDFATYDMFNITRAASVIEYAAMAATVYIIYRELRRLVRMHLGADPDITDHRLTDIYATHQHEADTGIVAGFIGFIVAAIINVVYLLLRADIAADFWLAAFLAVGIWVIYMANTLNQLYDQIEYKYM